MDKVERGKQRTVVVTNLELVKEADLSFLHKCDSFKPKDSRNFNVGVHDASDAKFFTIIYRRDPRDTVFSLKLLQEGHYEGEMIGTTVNISCGKSFKSDTTIRNGKNIIKGFEIKITKKEAPSAFIIKYQESRGMVHFVKIILLISSPTIPLLYEDQLDEIEKGIPLEAIKYLTKRDNIPVNTSGYQNDLGSLQQQFFGSCHWNLLYQTKGGSLYNKIEASLIKKTKSENLPENLSENLMNQEFSILLLTSKENDTPKTISLPNCEWIFSVNKPANSVIFGLFEGKGVIASFDENTFHVAKVPEINNFQITFKDLKNVCGFILVTVLPDQKRKELRIVLYAPSTLVTSIEKVIYADYLSNVFDPDLGLEPFFKKMNLTDFSNPPESNLQVYSPLNPSSSMTPSSVSGTDTPLIQQLPECLPEYLPEVLPIPNHQSELRIKLPEYGVIGSYEGGEDFGISRQIYFETLGEIQGVPIKDIRKKIKETYQDVMRDEDLNQIFKLPTQLPDLKKTTINYILHVSSQVYGKEGEKFNVLLQGWLLPKDLSKKKGQSYVGRGVAMGVIKSYGIKFEQDDSFLEEGKCKIFDQHVHTVDFSTESHYGPDVAKFSVENPLLVSVLYFYAYDFNENRLLIEILIICPGEAESVMTPEFCKNDLINIIVGLDWDICDQEFAETVKCITDSTDDITYKN